MDRLKTRQLFERKDFFMADYFVLCAVLSYWIKEPFVLHLPFCYALLAIHLPFMDDGLLHLLMPQSCPSLRALKLLFSNLSIWRSLLWFVGQFGSFEMTICL
jgi:hypothetical protein